MYQTYTPDSVMENCKPLHHGDTCRTVTGHAARYLKDGTALRKTAPDEPCPCYRFEEATPANGGERESDLPGDILMKIGEKVLASPGFHRGFCVPPELEALESSLRKEGRTLKVSIEVGKPLTGKDLPGIVNALHAAFPGRFEPEPEPETFWDRLRWLPFGKKRRASR